MSAKNDKTPYPSAGQFRATADNPLNVKILAFPGALLSSVASPSDVLQSAGTLWKRIHGEPQHPVFDVEVVSVDGGPVECFGGTRLLPSGSISDVTTADLIIFSAVIRNPDPELVWEPLVQWLKKMHGQGSHLASICTGAFLMAATGLLDGKTATTHWGAAQKFRQLYPQVNLKPRRIITDEGDLFCSGGSQAAIDLSLYLVEKYAGPDIAEQSARALVHDMWRESQVPYASFKFQKDHTDSPVLMGQDIIEKDHCQPWTIETLANRIGLTPRTFERRFKRATGDAPLTYLQRVRVEAAKDRLARSGETFDEITYAVGYADASSFRRLFTRLVGISPGRYRARFKHGPV